MLERLTGRKIKRLLKEILIKDTWKEEASEIIFNPDSPAIEPLFTCLYSTNKTIKWRAVTLLGLLSREIFKYNPEKVRILMRRCVWMLTEECGAIAWGVPELMGSIAASNSQIAKEFAHLIFAYINEFDGPDNFLEYEPLRKGVFWAVMSLSEIYPDLILQNKDILLQRMDAEETPEIIGLLCKIVENIRLREAEDFLTKNLNNESEIDIYLNEKLINIKVNLLAEMALKNLKQN